MANNVKVLIGELNGQELDQAEEYVLNFEDLNDVDLVTNPPNAGDRLEWNGSEWVAVPPTSGLEFGYSKQMGYNGTATVGRYLGYHHKIPSNMVPFSPPKNTVLKAFTIKTDQIDTGTISIRKNGTEIDTLIVTASDEAAKINLTHTILTTDEIDVKVVSGSVKDPIFHLYFG